MSRRILVTGGTGYLGGCLSKYLAQQGHAVTVWGRRQPDAEFGAWCDLMEDIWVADIRDPNMMERLASNRFEVVIHLAGMDYRLTESSSEVLEVNTVATWNLLQACAKGSSERVIYFSSERVLGKVPPEVIDESYLPRPNNQYGLSKLLSEELVAYYQGNSSLQGVNLRLSNVYGRPVFPEGTVWGYVVNQLCRQAVCEGEIHLTSNGAATRDFVHVSDVCHATEKLIEMENPELLYQVASGSTLSILEIARVIQRIYRERFHRDLPLILPEGEREERREVARYQLSIDRLSGLGFANRMSLESGIDDLFSYLQETNGT